MPCSRSALILVVDDEPTNLAAIRRILSPDYKLIFATNGQDALRLVAQQAPTLLLLDVQMPGMSGYEVLQQLHQAASTRHLPVIFITSLSELAEDVVGLEMGCVDYITKPVAAHVLHARIQAHLTRLCAACLETGSSSLLDEDGGGSHAGKCWQKSAD